MQTHRHIDQRPMCNGVFVDAVEVVVKVPPINGVLQDVIPVIPFLFNEFVEYSRLHLVQFWLSVPHKPFITHHRGNFNSPCKFPVGLQQPTDGVPCEIHVRVKV